MNAYDDDYDDRFRNPLAAYKPRAWNEGVSVPVTIKPEPTSKTNIAKKRIFAKNLTKPLAKPLTSIHDFGHSHYNKT
ncbi:MAG TPA: hypothetical protein PK002_01035 [Cellvibrio sp.]|nr:hypothetical protein [Cellvibrio sp.]